MRGKKSLKKLQKRVIVLPIIILLVIAVMLLGGYWSIKNRLSHLAKIPTQKQSISKTVAYPEETFYDYRDNYDDFYDQLEEGQRIQREKETEEKFAEMRETLKDIFDGNITYDQKIDEVEYFERGFWPVNITIRVYKHVSGHTKYKSGYEGVHWIEDLDLDVSSFKSLKPGVQTARFSHTHFLGGEAEVVAELKKIGTKNYALTQSSFHIGITLRRCYLTYNEEYGQIIYIYLNHSGIEKGEVEFDEYGRIKIPKNFNNFIVRFEEEVLANF